MEKTFYLIAILLVPLFCSCKDSGQGGGKSMLQAVTGSTRELMVVMPKPLWEGNVGDSIKAFFGQEQLGLPQGEPVFDLINLPPANFTRNAKAHRSILIAAINSRVDSASLRLYDSPWARTQKIFKISAPDKDSFLEVFRRNREKMMGVYLKAERDRMIEVYRKTADDRIFRHCKDKYDLLLYCPGGYRLNKDTCGFVWISQETKINSRGVVFFTEKYESESQLNFQVIQDRVCEELKKYIPGPLANTWMGLDKETPMTAAAFRYNDRHYALQIKGIWTVVNDFMGGPFVLDVVLDEDNNRIIYMMGYVYAPEEAKRNLLHQVESILYSMDIDFQEEKKGQE